MQSAEVRPVLQHLGPGAGPPACCQYSPQSSPCPTSQGSGAAPSASLTEDHLGLLAWYSSWYLHLSLVWLQQLSASVLTTSDSAPSEGVWLQLLWCCAQVDILSSDDEVQEVVKFVSDNAKRVLNVDAARVIPVSSRLALDAKLAVDDGSAGKALRHVLKNHQLHAHDMRLLK